MYEVPRVVRLTETESRMVVARGWEQGEAELLFNKSRASVWEEEKVLEMVGGNGCITMGTYLVPQNSPIKYSLNGLSYMLYIFITIK